MLSHAENLPKKYLADWISAESSVQQASNVKIVWLRGLVVDDEFCTGLQGWIRKSSKSKGSSSVNKMEGNGEFDNKQKCFIKDKRQW